jgi:protein phosphatase-4 regulatory subunit 3
MSADDVTKKSASTEPNDPDKPTDPTSRTLREEQITESHISNTSGPSKPAENGDVDQEVNEVGSRDITEAGDVVKRQIELSGEGVEPSSEPFVGSGDPLETPEGGEGVLAWSPEDDHEHKRVKVSV